MQPQKKRKVPTLVVEIKGTIVVMPRTQYMNILSDPDADIPKLLGVLMPKNRALIHWEEKPFNYNAEVVEKRLNPFQVDRLMNLVIGNLAYLANKSQKTFLNNFQETVINKLRKRL